MNKIEGILKLEGYGTYVTYLEDKIWVSPIVPETGGPTLDADDCIEWTELKKPPNQNFLNIVNDEFGSSVKYTDFIYIKGAMHKLLKKIRGAMG
ncbi:MAG: hypothetical protein DRO67_01760 [Candidatus Asgardarchaeum californiense]|nr:MAG: hypothetical protein DRO67_01760 [Candidatus Asgardarchaeum californiense]